MTWFPRWRTLLFGALVLVLVAAWAFSAYAAVTYLQNERTNQALAVFTKLTQNHKYEFIHALLDREGIDAVNRLLVAFDTPSASGLTYQFGTFMYAKYGTSAIAKCPKALLLGCRAGIIRAALMARGPDVLSEFITACGAGKPGIGYSCGHGIGHGTAEIKDFDVPSALIVCDGLATYAQAPCFGGIFQEYLEFAPAANFSEADLWQPCTGLSDQHRSVCAFTLPDLWYTRYQYTDEKIVSLCESSADSVIRENCLLGVGFRVTKLAKGDPTTIIARCADLLPENERPLCIIASANVLSVYTYPDWQSRVNTVCATLSPDLETICRAAPGTHTTFETNTLLTAYSF
jgi:hypothetical protein